MAYSGKFIIKNYKKYKGDFDNIIYRSLWEKSVFQWCDNNPSVKDINYFLDKEWKNNQKKIKHFKIKQHV